MTKHIELVDELVRQHDGSIDSLAAWVIGYSPELTEMLERDIAERKKRNMQRYDKEV